MKTSKICNMSENYKNKSEKDQLNSKDTEIAYNRGVIDTFNFLYANLCAIEEQPLMFDFKTTNEERSVIFKDMFIKMTKKLIKKPNYSNADKFCEKQSFDSILHETLVNAIKYE